MVLNEEQWIKELREKRVAYGISQGRLAVASGITREYLNKIESGKMKPSKELLETLHNQTADDPCKRFGGKLGVIKNVGIIKRLPAGIYGNGYRRSLDVYFECRQRS